MALPCPPPPHSQPPPPLIPAAPTELSICDPRHGPSRWPAGPSTDPLTPGKCYARSRSLPQTRGFTGQSCATSLQWGLPRKGEAPPTAWMLPPGQSHVSPSGRAVSPPSPTPAQMEARPPRLAYPVLLLPALSVALLSLHLQGDGGQAVLRPHQLLRQRRLLGLLQGQGLGRGREQRARGVGRSWGACLGLSPTLASEMCPTGGSGT